jgi:CheY-like chemotaxis protein
MADSILILYLCNEQQNLGIRFILSIAGYYVLTASTGNLALEILRRYPIDLILADESLTGQTGAELAQKMKRLKPEIPIALLVPSLNAKHLRSSEADMLLAREMDPPKFLAAVAQAVSRAPVGQEPRRLNQARG